MAIASRPPCFRISSASSCRCATTWRRPARPTTSSTRRWPRPGRRGSPNLDTILARGYEGGTELSGGQWQRVALARALCAVKLGAGVVLLDEPTAQLDVRGEAEIFERILAATRHATTILISHRFSTVRHADRICVLEGGRVVELGTHDELMAAGGRYRTMFDLQASRFGSEGAEEEGVELRCPHLTDLPPACPSMWRALKRGYQAEPRLLRSRSACRFWPPCRTRCWRSGSSCWPTACSITTALLVLAAAIGLGVSAAATWFLRVVSDRTQRRFRDRLTIALESHVARLQASVATIEHHERPRILGPAGGAAQPGLRARPHVHVAVLHLRLDPAAGRDRGSADVDSPGAGAAALRSRCRRCSTSAWRPGVERAAEEQGAPANRLARHLFVDGHHGAAGQGSARDRASATVWSPAAARPGNDGTGRSAAARWEQRALAHPGLGGLRRRLRRAPWSSRALISTGRPARCSWCWRPARGCRRTSAPPSARSASSAGSGLTARCAWPGSRTTRPPRWCMPISRYPQRLASGIRFDHVSFTYPGTDRLVLDDVCLDFKPGTVVAIVGENGAGKTTLVKLLCRLYQPTNGRILVDGLDLARLSVDAWRSRLAGAFQDFFRFEFRRGRRWGWAICRGSTMKRRCRSAVSRAGAEDVVDRLAVGARDTQLGPTWPAGCRDQLRPVAEAGAWRAASCATSRCCWCSTSRPPRSTPRPNTLSSSGSRRPRRNGKGDGQNGNGQTETAHGRITILVSHRFSTVRMADQIVVLDGARVAEAGSHEDLVRAAASTPSSTASRRPLTAKTGAHSNQGAAIRPLRLLLSDHHPEDVPAAWRRESPGFRPRPRG